MASVYGRINSIHFKMTNRRALAQKHEEITTSHITGNFTAALRHFEGRTASGDVTGGKVGAVEQQHDEDGEDQLSIGARNLWRTGPLYYQLHPRDMLSLPA